VRLPKLYPRLMRAEITAEVSDLGYKGQKGSGDLLKALQFIDVGKPPVSVSGEVETAGPVDGFIPGSGASAVVPGPGSILGPHQTRSRIGHRPVGVTVGVPVGVDVGVGDKMAFTIRSEYLQAKYQYPSSRQNPCPASCSALSEN